jgi:uncharacterized protein YciI
MYFMLFYDYVEDIVDRRGPHRDAHLRLAKEWVDRGELFIGGAFADPVDGAAIVLKVENRERAEEFVRTDPYVANGLVKTWRIRPWTVVVGAAL